MTVSSVDKCNRAAKCVIVRKGGSSECPYPRPCSDGRERAVPILEGDNERRDPRGAHGAPCSRWQNANAERNWDVGEGLTKLLSENSVWVEADLAVKAAYRARQEFESGARLVGPPRQAKSSGERWSHTSQTAARDMHRHDAFNARAVRRWAVRHSSAALAECCRRRDRPPPGSRTRVRRSSGDCGQGDLI